MLVLERRGKGKTILRRELPAFFHTVPSLSADTLTDLHLEMESFPSPSHRQHILLP